MRKLNKTIALLLSILLLAAPTISAQAVSFTYPLDTDNNLVIVIDPGHGGSNEGADYNGVKEKYITMTTALAMKQELEQYDGVTVYLTHSSPEDTMEISQRTAFAKSVNADFFFSVHYNAKGTHDMYGSEVWIPKSGSYNREAYRFATLALNQYSAMGLYIRGIKTKSSKSGGEYYGVLKYCSDLGITSCILEHCHMDNAVDAGYWDSTADLQRFGIADATAVAQYFGLTSTSKGVSYAGGLAANLSGSSYAVEDTTVPETCQIEIASYDSATNTANINIKAKDSNSPILYYSVSTDGVTFNSWQKYPGANALSEYSPEVVSVTVQNVTNASDIMVMVSNKYDLYALSNAVSVASYIANPTAASMKPSNIDTTTEATMPSPEEVEVEIVDEVQEEPQKLPEVVSPDRNVQELKSEADRLEEISEADLSLDSTSVSDSSELAMDVTDASNRKSSINTSQILAILIGVIALMLAITLTYIILSYVSEQKKKKRRRRK